MSGYDTILFDLDGTLTDPKVGITRSVIYALDKMGIAESDADFLECFIGPPLIVSFQKHYAMSEAEARQATVFYREYFSVTGMYENTVYPGIPEMLARLRSANKRLIVATSKPTCFAEPILQHFGLHHHFSLIVGANLDGTRIAKAEVIAHALSELDGAVRGGVVMVGDRDLDILGARQAGVDSIGVTYGYGSREELELASPTHLIHSVKELGGLLLDGVIL